MKVMILSLMSISLVAMEPKPLNNIVTVNVTLPPEHRHHHHHKQAQALKEQKEIPDDASCGQCCGVLLSLLKSVAKLVK